MARAAYWELTPRQSIERECTLRGRHAVVGGCIALLAAGRVAVDDSLVIALGGPPARRLLTGESRADPRVWMRVWALRGLLWTWSDEATAVLGEALSDEAWRVREMAVKVTRRHLVSEHVAVLAELETEDPSIRVRAAARTALVHITDQLA